jgi:hypothetical protein
LGVARRPYLIVPDLTVEAAAAPQDRVRVAAVGFSLWGLLLIPALLFLSRIFKRAARSAEGH